MYLSLDKESEFIKKRNDTLKEIMDIYKKKTDQDIAL